MLLKRYCTRLVFALDADATGEEAVKRGTDEAEKLDFEIEVMVLDFAKDPDEAVRKDLVRFKRHLQTEFRCTILFFPRFCESIQSMIHLARSK